MLNFLHKLIIAIITASTAFTLTLHGVTSNSATNTVSNLGISSNNQTTSTSTELEQLQKTLADQQATQVKLEKEITSLNQKGSVNSNKIVTPSISTGNGSKTFTTPNGTVISDTGSVLNSPTVPAPSQTTEQGTLTAKQIVSKVAPSVALISTSEGTGSGIVISDGKYILTNAHVVGNNQFVDVYLPNGSFNVPVLGRNTSIDLAIIYIGGKSAPAAILGSSDTDSLSIGDDVYALGFPFSNSIDLTNLTLTHGVLSARQIPSGDATTMLQTDAAVNPGNSGGPLVNNKGEVVGIVTSKVSASLGSGIGFAIPINTAEIYFQSLSQNGQSRYELYPIGSTMDIPASVLLSMQLNPLVDCDQLAFTPSQVSTCNFYRSYSKDYNWNVIKDQ